MEPLRDSMTIDADQAARARDDAAKAALVAVAWGDVPAFRRVVDAYGDAMHAFALRMLGSRAEACDATQEVFLRAFRSAARYDPAGPLRPWLYAIARNVCLNLLSRRRRDASLSPELAAATDPANELDARRGVARLERALETLEPRSRELIVLHFIEGLDYDEISRVTGDSPGALRVRLHRARETLKALLEDDEAPERRRR